MISYNLPNFSIECVIVALYSSQLWPSLIIPKETKSARHVLGKVLKKYSIMKKPAATSLEASSGICGGGRRFHLIHSIFYLSFKKKGKIRVGREKKTILI